MKGPHFGKPCGAPDCGRPLGRQNQSGYCKHHAPQAMRSPEHNARIKEGWRRKLLADPEFLDTLRKRLARARQSPKNAEANRRRIIETRLWERALAACTPEVRAKAGRNRSASMLAWCPEELRDEYRALLRRNDMNAASAKAAILEQHEANMRRLRAKMGVTGEVGPIAEPVFRQSGNDTSTPQYAERLEAVKAERVRIDALRQHRTLCPVCGARSDVGCEHGAAA